MLHGNYPNFIASNASVKSIQSWRENLIFTHLWNFIVTDRSHYFGFPTFNVNVDIWLISIGATVENHQRFGGWSRILRKIMEYYQNKEIGKMFQE